ncbi:protein turtle homolog A-like isoform X2 [Scyliorhinus torazame]|uniref:protein turtle homolog A-like isoform X2 n=1 Tax=Scyliorhinus torazame TaxID=75743 RepID=UPI003B59BF86
MWFSRLLYLPLAAFWTLTVCLTVPLPTRHQRVAKTVREREGESAFLNCDLTVKKEDQTTQVIEWLHEGLVLPIFIKFGLHPPRIDGAYLGRLRLLQGASLRVDNLRATDEGWYQCRILFLTQHYHSQNGSWIYLSVTTPPSFWSTPPRLVEILLGEPAHLRCEANGRPKPLVSWSKDEHVLPLPAGDPDGRRYQVANGSLRIEPVDRGSAGVYTCEARSETGAITHNTRLLVRGPPTIVQRPSNVTVNYTQDALFSCQAEAYPSNLTYSWFKDGFNVHRHSSLHSRVTVLTDGSLLVRGTLPGDTGSYTCVPSNGLAVSPEASAYLSILHPAYTQDMPRLTVLPVGMQGYIPCPSVASPPLLYVNWTKNGLALELDKDPPRFVQMPAQQYEQVVGRELRISCTATGDPEPSITWSKDGSCNQCQFQILKDGTLFFRSIRKDHHGQWTCEARNNVTQIRSRTTVLVLGTSPHAVSNVTVRPDVLGINVTWDPGFDGGHSQQFTVWFRQITNGPHDWIIRMVPADNCSLWVGGLWPDTEYQFSVLAQSERGSGPFSQIVNVRTLSVAMVTAAPATVWPSLLLPPWDLKANRTASGILLCWAPPPPPSRLPLGYMLEFREGGSWAVLQNEIPARQHQMVLKGLVKDVSYQLRMISRNEKLVSEPSEIVNVSTAGMSSYPSGNRILETLSQSIRAGIIAGACFLTSALFISLLVSYLMKKRRMRRARRMQNSPIFFSRYQKASNFDRSDSPDSLLKLKLETPLYETFEHAAVSRRRSSGEKHAQYETHLGSLESIQRGPDGRFVVRRQPGPRVTPLVPHFETSSTHAKSDACPQVQGVRVSAPLRAKARGQARGRPRACYFAMASSSPTDGSQPPFIPDLSPIPRPLVCEPRCRPILSDGKTGFSARPSHSLLELASIVAGDRGLSHGLSWPGPLETADPSHLLTGLAFEPTKVGRSGIPRGPHLPGGCGAASVSGLERCRPQARPNPDFPRDRGAMGQRPSFALSEAPGSSPAPNSSGYHSADASRRASEERSSDRRDFLAGEKYEWNEGLAMNSEILEALRPHQRPRRPNSSIALQDLALTGSSMSSDLRRSRTVQSLEVPGGVSTLHQSRSSTESRCAALREEFQEYRRRKEREQSEGAQGKDLSSFGSLEQATLL